MSNKSNRSLPRGGFFLGARCVGSAIVYLDESGDLGWKFDSPYRRGGSSRFLTIAAVIAPTEKKHLPKRLIKKLYQKYKWPTSEEMKWAQMSKLQKLDFSSRVKALCSSNPDIHIRAITVRKENVAPERQSDSNKLYNYMIKKFLCEYMTQYESITLVPDPRTIRVESGNSLHDYLQTELWFELNSNTQLATCPVDSANCLGLQFADMLSGVVRAQYEDLNEDYFKVLADDLENHELFF
ncbi:DUF3800 domain-containing protein [Thalassolituus sp. C2-1]|nr:DUF3800 domain-containing protein [Thalassolituus sp. C2-1]